jgi:hypothetical protein
VSHGFTAKQVDLIMDAAKTLLPVTTAYLAFAAATAKYMFESGVVLRRGRLATLSVVFAFALASLAAWIIAIAGAVDAARAFPSEGAAVSVPSADVGWSIAVRGEQAAVALFFVSVTIYCGLVIYTFLLRGRVEQSQAATE